uniref:Decapping nuclease n=1 Tax=Rhabditophanes sp. KR3021 TaxID=114890 RepID=A0AC35TR46_9BILA
METESTWEENVCLCQVDNPETSVKLTSAIISNAKTNDYSIDDICNELYGFDDKGNVSGEMDVEARTPKGKEKISKLVNSNLNDDVYIAATNEYDEWFIMAQCKHVEYTNGKGTIRVGHDPSRELYCVKPSRPTAFKDTASLREINYEKDKSYGYQPENVAKSDLQTLTEIIDFVKTVALDQSSNDSFFTADISFVHDGDTVHPTNTPYKANPETPKSVKKKVGSGRENICWILLEIINI